MDLPARDPVTVRDRLDVANLVSYLRRETRERPVVVLTVAPGHTAPYASAAELAGVAKGRADVVTIPTDDLTWQFSESLDDPQAGTYRGACRVYPAGADWESHPLTVPLRMARDRTEIANLPRLIEDDLRRHLERPPTRPTKPVPRPSPARAPIPSAPSPVLSLGTIATDAEASALAAYLESPARTQPAVVVSRSADAPAAFADIAQLRDDLVGLAQVHEITTIEASWAFSHAVPDMCQVYGGASRVYPIGTAWMDDPYLSPLRFAHSPRDRTTVTRQLVADAMNMTSGGSHTVPAGATKAPTVTGEVSGIAAGRALVNLRDQFPAVLWPELVEPGLPAERLFRKGMQVRGTLDPESRRIDVRAMRQEPGVAVSHYQAGDTILARVSAVTADQCTIELFPRLEHTLTVSDVTDVPTDLRELLSVGEVLPVWFGGRDGDEWLLSLPDANPDAARPAPNILVGGPPWLVPSVAEPSDVSDHQVSKPEDVVADGFVLEPSAQVVEALRRQIAQQTELLREAESTIAQLTDELATARTQRRMAVTRRSTDSDDAALFLDPREQLDFEIRQAWARMVQPSEKATYPLKKWTYGPEFIDTLHSVEGVKRAKVVEVIVHVLTGRDAELTSRGLHQLRTGRGGDNPSVTRAGGELCWRVSLQTKTPGARRLHYWMCNDGSVELSSIRVHDDTRP
ncbi:MAG: hypothetical protein QM619_07705 [Micropruina sp.]|uniref:hypothetical protein n=1 Tax=Micropruina sp. TaxID=2737536 RepID=UPI0039E70817